MTPLPRQRASAGSLALVLVALCSSPASAQTTSEKLANAPPILRVEEDWEAFIAEPDPSLTIPQIVFVFGPTNAEFGTHTVFELNHGTLPEYSAGGMQLQVWWGPYLIAFQSRYSPTPLSNPDELIRLTTVTEIKNGRLVMGVENGQSLTWGSFGGNEHLEVSLLTNRDDLNPYDPDHSVAQSRVTFGANRVSYFCRKSIRFYSEEGLFLEDSEPQYVHRLAPPPEAAQ